MKVDYTLYLVAEERLIRDSSLSIETAVEEAILGGVTLVQLREKESSALEFYNLSIKVKNITDKYNIPLIINDRLDIMLATDAAGVHLGQDDMPVAAARRLVGKDKIIGASARTTKEAIRAEEDGASYIGAGSVFNTITKKDAKRISMEELKDMTSAVSIPVIAIGGVKKDNIEMLKDTGIKGIAVVSAILSEKNIKKAAEDLLFRSKELFSQ